MLLIFSVNKHGLFLWKITKAQHLLMLFQKVSKEFNHKPNKIWADKGWKFYKRSMKSWLEENAKEMYSKHNQGKSVVAERIKFINQWLQYQKICILIN